MGIDGSCDNGPFELIKSLKKGGEVDKDYKEGHQVWQKGLGKGH